MTRYGSDDNARAAWLAQGAGLPAEEEALRERERDSRWEGPPSSCGPMTARLWVLGAGDPEMERIEALLIKAGEVVVHATAPGRDGRPARVHPGNAYGALAPSVLPGTETVILVECECDGLRDGDDPPWRVVVVDHHRPGDPGFGCPPAGFLAASSVGQVVARLAAEGLLAGWVVCVAQDAQGRTACTAIPPDLVYAAAADHCLTAAYAAQCPGVNPGRLAAWRDAVRASFQKRPVAAVQADREAAEAVLRDAPQIALGVPPHACAPECKWGERCGGGPDSLAAGDAAGCPPPVLVRDVRALGAVPELPEAAARLGVAVVYRLLPGDPGGDRGGRVKVGILGAGEGTPAGTAPVEAFLGGWAARQGLVDLYPPHDGTPEGLLVAAARGFAGAYEAAP